MNTPAAVEILHSYKLNNLHFGEAAQTNHSLYLYKPTPGMKSKHESDYVKHQHVSGESVIFTHPDSTHHICDVQYLSGHGIFVMTGCGGEPEFLECLIHQFLQGQRCLGILRVH